MTPSAFLNSKIVYSYKNISTGIKEYSNICLEVASFYCYSKFSTLFLPLLKSYCNCTMSFHNLITIFCICGYDVKSVTLNLSSLFSLESIRFYYIFISFIFYMSELEEIFRLLFLFVSNLVDSFFDLNELFLNLSPKNYARIGFYKSLLLFH